MPADPDQDFIDLVNQRYGGASPTPGGATATMTPDPDQDFIDLVNKKYGSPTLSPTATAEPSRTPQTDAAAQKAGSTFSQLSQVGTGTGVVQTLAGSAARGFLPGRAMLAGYPIGSVLGAAGVGALRGALVGAAVPIAGETGISEVIGGVLGGLISGGIAAWGASKLQTGIADVVAPQTVFGSKAEQAQVAAHPYAAIVGGGLAFGKPNPMSVVKAGKTLASQEGRAALVAFNKTKGAGMTPQAVDEVGNVINVAMGGGLVSAFNVKDQIESGHFDPEQLAVAAATGLLFNQPWFHKPNPAAAVAAKVMAKGGVPGAGAGPSPPIGPPMAPPGIVPPGVVPPEVSPGRPRVPGLLDFETMPPPVSEAARVAERPLPEAPIPRPGTETIPTAREGGEISAPQERQVGEGGVREHIGVPQGENIPAHPEEVRAVGGEQAGNSGGVRTAETEPITAEAYDPIDQAAWLTKEGKKVTGASHPTITDEYGAFPREGAIPGFVTESGKFLNSRDAYEHAVKMRQIERDKDTQILEASSFETIRKDRPRVDPRVERIAQIEDEINDYYDRREFPPKALHDERKQLEAELKKEHEQELVAGTEEHQARGGDELVDVLKQHGLPLTGEVKNYQGELNNIREMFGSIGSKTGRKGFGNVTTGTGEKLNYQNVFRAGGGDLDSLTNVLRQKGFTTPEGKLVETPSDALNLIENRLRTGDKVFGSEARAEALGGEQGPMRMRVKHPFGGFFEKKERFTVSRGSGGSYTITDNSTGKPIGTTMTRESAQNLADHYNVHIPKPIHKEQTGADIIEGEFKKVQAREAENLRNDPVRQDKVISEVIAAEPPVHLDNTPGRRIVSTSQDEDQVERLLGKDAYKSSIVNVVIKELLQNGFDAVRDGGASEQKPGQIAIDYDYNTRTISVRDNGVGMDPETIVSAFLRTGGTKKSGDYQNTSGGLGIAKIAFLKGSERIKLVTVKDGLKTVMDVDQAQIKSKQIPLDSFHTNEPNGTTVTVKIPETYVDLNGETQQVWFDTDPDFLKNPLFGPVEVTINGEKAPMGLHTEGWQKDNRFNFRWGHADVYVDPRPLGKYSWGADRDPTYSVMSAGLHQFDISWGRIFDKADDRIPHNIVIDVRPHVDTKSPNYPFNNQREGWRGTVERDAAAMYAYLKRQGIEQELKKAQETFSKVKVLPKISMGEFGKDLTPEQVAQTEASQSEKGSVTLPKVTSIDVQPDKVVTNYSTGKKSVQSHEQFNKSTFSAEREIDFRKSKLDTSHLDSDAPLYHNNTNVDFTKIPGAPELHTKLGNMFVGFMREFGRVFGKESGAPEIYKDLVSTDPEKRWLGGISYDTEYAGLNIMNPFKSLWFNPSGISDGAMAAGPRRAATESLHTMLHEITHLPQRNEGSGFTRELTNNIGRMVEPGFPYQKLEDALLQVYTKHWKTLNEIHEQFYHPNTKNSAESFKAGSALGAESRGTKRPDENVPSEHAPEDVSVQEQGPTGTGRAGGADRKIGSIGDILTGQKPGVTGAEPAPAPVAATEPVGGPEGGAPAPALHQGIKETLGVIKEAAAQPPVTPEEGRYAPPPVEAGEHEPRPPTPNEAAGPGLREMSDQEMTRVIGDSLQRYHEPGITTSLDSSGGLSHNDIIDAGRSAIRRGVDPEAVARSRAIPSEMKYTVVKAHGEDLREVSERAEHLANTHPSQVNKDAAEQAFSDYSNWDNEVVRPNREKMDLDNPGMPPEEFNPRSLTDLRQQMVRQNNRDFTESERKSAEEHVRQINKAVEARNKELMKRDAELEKASPDLVKDLKNGDDLFEYTANIMKKLFPCT